MLQGTTSTDTERVKHLTLRGLNRVGIKAGLGLLLSLSLIGALFSFLMEANSITMVLVVLLIGLASGILVAVAITTAITAPVRKLVSASQAIARGDLSQRVDIQSKDEFGKLGQAFNEMALQRQRAYEELEIRAKERTSELRAANEELEASNDSLIAEFNERLRLEEVERRRSQELAVADEVAQIITSTLDIDQVYERFALEVKKLVDFDRMNINIIDYDRDIYEIKYQFGEVAPKRSVSATGPLEGTVTGQVADTGRTLVQRDIALDPRSPQGDKYLKMGMRSNVKVPLISKGRVIGTLGLRSRRVGAYGQWEQAILEWLAHQIAPALENAQLYQRLQASMEEMDLVDEVARIVTSTLNIDEVYERFTQELKKLVDFDRIAINIIDPTAQAFLIKYLWGPTQPSRRQGDIVPLEGTVTQQVFQTRQTLTSEDLSKDIHTGARLTTEGGYLRLGLRSSIAVPLISKGSIIGSFVLRSCQLGHYGSKEQAILERLAHQIAPAVENARLHEEQLGAEEQLSQAQKMQSVGQLAGGVAHDFNNLLTAIMGYVQLSLWEAPPESNISNNLQEVGKAAERAANLTGQLLAFSRRQVIEPKVIDLNDLVINLDKMLRRLIGEDVELVTLPATGLEPIQADPGQMEQVLVNLAVNARDAMPAGGKLTIKTANVTLDAEYVQQHGDASPGRHVMVAVSDTGTGISEEVREHIFEPFFTTKEVGEGTGLGLATCFGIVQQNGGHIEVDSEPGQGTSFKVYLPVTEETYEAETEIVDSSNSPQGKETVLLAEDEPLVRSMVATVLRDRGYEVLEAANGEEALRMVQQYGGEGIDLLVTDVVMPQMGGPELAEKLHTAHVNIKVLFTSGYTGDYQSHLNTLTTGTDFLAKPYMPDALTVKVREVLDQRPPVPSGSGSP